MILITGASGFIGAQLVADLLANNHKIRCFVRSSSNVSHLKRIAKDYGKEGLMEIVRGDMTDEHSIVRSLQEVQAVVHLAAATSEQVHDKKHAWDVNVGGAKRLVDSCKKGKVKRLIVVSSESCKRKVRGVYAETKARADEIFMKSSLEVTIIRPTLVYG